MMKVNKNIVEELAKVYKGNVQLNEMVKNGSYWAKKERTEEGKDVYTFGIYKGAIVKISLINNCWQLVTTENNEKKYEKFIDELRKELCNDNWTSNENIVVEHLESYNFESNEDVKTVEKNGVTEVYVYGRLVGTIKKIDAEYMQVKYLCSPQDLKTVDKIDEVARKWTKEMIQNFKKANN